ncbi:cupin domain-containing protein [Aspergillus lucknowensis]|uniref:Cupin type-2 domain-containing protein n=1 Tax=Aspergillus lucknowensis TaxID=176173 RepID=A0ABR4LS42_9EURO
MSPTPEKTLRPLSRFITTHNPEGKAIFSTTLPESMPVNPVPDGADFSLAYTSSRFPARLALDADIPEYAAYLEPGNSPGLVISTGSVCRIVDVPPGSLSPMHRTVSLDYGVVLEGVVELVLDSGETRTLHRGDVAVQRGTNHAWRNVTPPVVGEDGVERGQWARMLYVLLPAEEVEVGGRVLGEELAGMGVPRSK